jgi:hypothetical protein
MRLQFITPQSLLSDIMPLEIDAELLYCNESDIHRCRCQAIKSLILQYIKLHTEAVGYCINRYTSGCFIYTPSRDNASQHIKWYRGSNAESYELNVHIIDSSMSGWNETDTKNTGNVSAYDKFDTKVKYTCVAATALAFTVMLVSVLRMPRRNR